MPGQPARPLASSGDDKAKAYADAGQQMIDDQIVIPIVNTQLVLASRASPNFVAE